MVGCVVNRLAAALFTAPAVPLPACLPSALCLLQETKRDKEARPQGHNSALEEHVRHAAGQIANHSCLHQQKNAIALTHNSACHAVLPTRPCLLATDQHKQTHTGRPFWSTTAVHAKNDHSSTEVDMSHAHQARVPCKQHGLMASNSTHEAQ